MPSVVGTSASRTAPAAMPDESRERHALRAEAVREAPGRHARQRDHAAARPTARVPPRRPRARAPATGRTVRRRAWPSPPSRRARSSRGSPPARDRAASPAASTVSDACALGHDEETRADGGGQQQRQVEHAETAAPDRRRERVGGERQREQQRAQRIEARAGPRSAREVPPAGNDGRAPTPGGPAARSRGRSPASPRRRSARRRATGRARCRPRTSCRAIPSRCRCAPSAPSRRPSPSRAPS